MAKRKKHSKGSSHRGAGYRSRATKLQGYGLGDYLKKTRLLSNIGSVAIPITTVLNPFLGAAMASGTIAARMGGMGRKKRRRRAMM